MAVNPDAWLKRPGIRRLLTALDATRDTARFVGGAVRDTMLGHPIEDLDLATTLTPDEVINRLEKARIKAVPTGIDHGTITAVSSGTVVEVTTLRSDVSTDGRRATVAFTGDWRADAARRDFTINALYADPYSGVVHDYHSGKADIAERRVRFIGDPLQRIAEDHLRILRFFRFHARFGAGQPDGAGLAACSARANDLMALSRERIADELLKLLALPDPSPTVAVMADGGIFAPVIPEVVGDAAARIAALAKAEREAGITPAAVRRLAAMLPPDPAVASDVAARLKLSNKARKRLTLAATPLDPSETPGALAYAIGAEAALDRMLLAGDATGAAKLAAWPVPKLPITGGELIRRGVTQGPEVARTLREVERRWVAAGFPAGDPFEQLVAATLDEGDCR